MNSTCEEYVCLYVHEFATQSLLRLRAQMRCKPSVVMEGEPPLLHICSLNQPARSLGLEHGMTQVEVETFPSVTVLRRSHHEEDATKAVLLECAGSITSRVEGHDRNGAFACLLDIAGTYRLFGAPEALMRTLIERVRVHNISASAASSRNLYTALALARHAPPQSVHVVAPGREAEALAPLPLTVLDLTEEQAEMLALWGIRTLGMLAALPEVELVARMGQQGSQLHTLASGTMKHLFQPKHPPLTLAEHIELDAPVELLEAFLFVVNLMLEQVIVRASAHMVALASVTLSLTLAGNTTHVRTVRPALPCNDRNLWLKLLHLDLEAHPPQSAILAVTLQAEPGETSKVQLGLFAPQMPEPARLDVTLARIRAIVGEGNAGRAVLEDTHRAEAFRVEPFRVPTARLAINASQRLHTPRRRLRPPEPVRVSLRGGRPEHFTFRRQRYKVERAYGPWLTSGDWWQATLWKCEQWDLVARDDGGSTLFCCVVHDRMLMQWRMEALYD